MKKLLCPVLALVIILALAACGKTESPVSNTDLGDAATTETSSYAEDIAKNEETTTQSLVDPTTNADETSAEDGTTQPGETNLETTSGAATTKPTSIEEIVAYYNAAANKVKTAKPGYSFKELTSINSINGGSKWLADTINKIVASNASPSATVAKNTNHNDFAVPGKDWASKLRSSGVQSATCTDKGTSYEIRINMKREARADLPKSVEDHEHGRAFKVFSAGQMYGMLEGYEYLGKITKFAPTYHDSYIVCIIDKASGSMKSAKYHLTFDAQIEGKLASAIPVKGAASITMVGNYTF